jgi:hypothetical protein
MHINLEKDKKKDLKKIRISNSIILMLWDFYFWISFDPQKHLLKP